MLFHVQLEAVAMATRVAALRALVGLLVRMNLFVAAQVRLILEGFTAFVASVRACVCEYR